jgi:hypothetical protein
MYNTTLLYACNMYVLSMVTDGSGCGETSDSAACNQINALDRLCIQARFGANNLKLEAVCQTRTAYPNGPIWVFY